MSKHSTSISSVHLNITYGIAVVVGEAGFVAVEDLKS